MKKSAPGDRRPARAPAEAAGTKKRARAPQRGEKALGGKLCSQIGRRRQSRAGEEPTSIGETAAPASNGSVTQRRRTPAPQDTAVKRRAGLPAADLFGAARGPIRGAATDAQRARAQMLKRLAVLRELVWRELRRAPLKAIDRALKIDEREAALLGLDFPRRHQVVNFDVAEKIPVAVLREYLTRAIPPPPSRSAPAADPAASLEPGAPTLSPAPRARIERS